MMNQKSAKSVNLKNTPILTHLSHCSQSGDYLSDLEYKSTYKMPSTFRVYPRTDKKRKDGTCLLFLSIRISGEEIRTSTNIIVDPKKWNKAKQELRGSTESIKEKNLLIRIVKAKVDTIIVNYRIEGKPISKKNFLDRFHDKHSELDFLAWWEKDLEAQEGGEVKESTLKQQASTLRKLKRFTPVLPFHEIDHQFLDQFDRYLRVKLGNCGNTVFTARKNLRKYLNRAKKQGYKFPLETKEIKTKQEASDRTSLSIEELTTVVEMYDSNTLSESAQDALRRFLFSCYTGLRLSDNLSLTHDNFENGYLFFKAKKVGKLQKFKLSTSAKKYICKGEEPLPGYKTPQVINRHIKKIMKKCGIKKDISFHCSRHTFATIFLELGGNVTVLQKLMGHSNIKETMIYVHISGKLQGDGLALFDKI